MLILTLLISLPPHLFQPRSGSYFPYTQAYLLLPPPYLTCRRPFYLSMQLLLPPPPLSSGRGATIHLDGAHSCGPPPATAHLRFPPIPGSPKEFLARSVPAFPYPVAPPCRPRPVPRSLLDPGFSRPRVSSSLFLPTSTSRSPLPPFRNRPAAQSPVGLG